MSFCDIAFCCIKEGKFMSFDKNGVYALVGVNTSSECMTKLDDKYYYPTVDSVTLVNIRDL